MIFVDPVNNVVISAHGNSSTAVNSPYHKHLGAVTNAIRQQITQ